MQDELFEIPKPEPEVRLIPERTTQRAILYTRVSTDRQAREGVSLENQEQRLRQYATYHGFTDVELIADEGFSGKSTDRPGFQRVMQAVREKTVMP